MDTFTHALSGALAARATAPHAAGADTLPLRRRVLAGFLSAAAPDLDFVIGYAGPIEYLLHHRGATHSIVMLPLWAFLLAHVFSLVWRRDRAWRAYYGVAALGIGAHIAGDLITSFGTMIFVPLLDARIAFGTTFIIDLWFSGIIVAALLASLAWRSSRAPAVAGLAVLAGYVGWQALLQREAVAFGEAYAREAGFVNPRVTAQPRPVSPRNWMVVVEEGERLDYAMVRLARGEPPPQPAPGAGFIARIAAHYLPPDHVQWVKTMRFGSDPADAALAREAWFQPKFEFFRWFALYPVLHRVERGNPDLCVWFQDLRFFTPGRKRFPFRYGLCREGAGPWQRYELARDGSRLPLN